MRKLLTVVTLITLGSIGAANATNTNVPTWSPYSIVPQGNEPAMQEGRSAYIDRGPIQGRHRMRPGSRDWGSVGLSPGNTGDYSNYF
jgi:hypothetical protein